MIKIALEDIKISVIIPAFNCEKTIEECLDSVLSQSVKNIEVIVIDDGSDDKTYEIVKKRVILDSRLILVRQKNAGPSVARNHGIKLAKGQFLNFVDADDIILKGMFERLLSYQREYNADLVISGIRKIVERKKERVCVEEKLDQIYYYNNKAEIRSHFIGMLGKGINSPVGRLYKTDIIKKNNLYFNELLDMGEDLQFNIQYIDNINSILFVPDVLYQYNTFNSILTFKYREDLFEKRKVTIELLEDFLEKNEIEKNIIYYLYIKLVYATVMQEIEHKIGLKERYRKIRELLELYVVRKAIKEYVPKDKAEWLMFQIVKMRIPCFIDFSSFLFVKLRKNTIIFSHRISV